MEISVGRWTAVAVCSYSVLTMTIQRLRTAFYVRMYAHIFIIFLAFNYGTRFYIGHTPVLVTANPEMVEEITIKQSANFMNRTVGVLMQHK